MARAGKRPTAGQEIRLADIEADASTGMGVFEALNGHESPAALAMALKDAASRYHGAVGADWLRFVVRDLAKLANIIGDGIQQFVSE